MNILVLGGCGMQGKAVLFDLSKDEDVKEIICADYSPENLGKFKIFLNMDKIRLTNLDASKKEEIVTLMKKSIDVVIDLLPFQFMQNVIESSIEAGVNLVNTNYAHNFRHLGSKAEQRGISIMPECGLDPGIDLVIYGHAIKEFDEVHILNSYCGGIPEKNACDNPLNYKICWNWELALKAQKRKTIFIKHGEKLVIPPENQHHNITIHEIDFPGLGKLEAFPNGDAVFYTDLLGITKTIKETGRYTLRWPGWCSFWHPLKQLNFLGDNFIEGLPCKVSPLEFTIKLLEPQLQYRNNEKDLAIMYNVFSGIKNGKKKKLINSIFIERDLKTGLLAMSLGVGYPVSIVARMIAKGEINKKGILSPTTDIPYEKFMKRLNQRGIKVDEKIEFEG